MIDSHTSKTRLSGFIVAALGIVFGDIGTSPLYVLKTVVNLSGGTPSHNTALGLLSLIIWALLIITALKYVTLLMRVNNRGEGGILALMSLLGAKKQKRPLIMIIALLGAALIYSDGAITPAISVLSALEGLQIAAPVLSHYILPASVVILITLFLFQSHGTDKIGWIFGPIMIVWFVVIALLGLNGILKYPAVLAAINPYYALNYLFTHGATGYLTLGGVFLCVTGAEALYADMGHVGGRSIRIAWYGLVLPALLLNYAGQTALLLSGTADNNGLYFYQLCPAPLLVPLIILATCATVIASQSIVTGAFSMTRQAIQLGWCPRLHITQTSSKGYGQIYVGVVNWMLMIVTVGLAIAFGSSDRLVSAYGIAVSMTMVLTSLLLFIAMREVLRWPLMISASFLAFFLIIDLAFLGANLLKIVDGGWVPIVIASAIYLLMHIWHRGSAVIKQALATMTEPLSHFITRFKAHPFPRVPGTGVFLTRTRFEVPPVLTGHLKLNKALHEHILLLSVVTDEVPVVDSENRLEVEMLAPNFWRARAHVGFMETPNVPEIIRRLPAQGVALDPDDVTYYIGSETLLHSRDSKGIPAWQEHIFSAMQRNSNQTPDFFNLPHDCVVEIGRWIEI